MGQINELGHDFEGIEDDEIHKYIILLVGAGDEPVHGKVKLQKMIFMLAESIKDLNDEADYEPYYYGPYSETVDYECKYLENVGILQVRSNKICLTNIGENIMKKIGKKTENKRLREIESCKEFLNDLTNNELLAYIYTTYPNMTGKSVVYEKIQSEKEYLILSLIKKGKISSERGAELLCTTMAHIIKKMNKKGMQVLR